MKFMYGLFVLCCFLYPISVSAEYYRYTDKDGIVMFTDNLADIPMAQRNEANMYKEVTGPANPDQDPKKEQESLKEDTNKQIAESKQKDNIKESETLSQIQILNNEKQILDKEYEQLVTKKQILKKEKASISTSTELKAYKNEIKILNQQIIDFENRRQKFEEKATEFNAKDAQ